MDIHTALKRRIAQVNGIKCQDIKSVDVYRCQGGETTIDFYVRSAKKSSCVMTGLSQIQVDNLLLGKRDKGLNQKLRLHACNKHVRL